MPITFTPLGASGPSFQCDNPKAPGICYEVGVTGVFSTAQRAINSMVGQFTGAKSVGVDGKIGAATAEAAAKVASFLHGHFAVPGVGQQAGALSAVLQGTKEALAQHAEGFTAAVTAFLASRGKTPSTGGGGAVVVRPAPASGPVEIPAIPGITAPAASSKKTLIWWIAGAAATAGIGFLGYSVYRRQAEGG